MYPIYRTNLRDEERRDSRIWNSTAGNAATGNGVISTVIVYASKGPTGQGNTPADYVILSAIIVARRVHGARAASGRTVEADAG